MSGRTRAGVAMASVAACLAAAGVVVATGARATPAAQVVRLSGADRVATSIAVSGDAFPSGQATAAVLARADGFPDALAGAALAVAKGGPLLLTWPQALEPRVGAELGRAVAAGGTVYLLGGTAALSPAVANAVTALGFQVARLGGADRFETATIIAQGMGNPATVFVTTGMNFPDALVSGVAAAQAHGAVLLTDDNAMPTATSAYLAAHASDTVHAVGAAAAGAAGGTATDQFAGADRYETARLVAEHFFPAPASVGIASGVSFADALSGGAHIARRGGPLLLSDPTALSQAAQAYLTAHQATITNAYIYGGTAAVSAFTAAGVQAAVTGAPPPPTTTTTTGGAHHFSTLPPGSALPDDATCASEVTPTPENRPDNGLTNGARGTQKNLTSPYPTFTRVDGNFTGTTDEIIQWVACKWGIDEDVVRAQAVVESWWRQSTLGDWTSNGAVCAPNHPIGSDPGHPGECPESVGLLQVRYQYWSNGFNDVETSTAYNADYAYAAWRACFEGEETWLNTVDRVGTYGPGDMWGCLGVWYSGRWHTSAAEGYITNVQATMNSRVWEQPQFVG